MFLLFRRFVWRGAALVGVRWRLSAFRQYKSYGSYRTYRSYGFTLLELLAVIALIAVLAGLMLGVGRRSGETARIARARAELAAIAAALENYQRTQGDYPRTDDGARLLQSLIGRRGPTNALIAGRSLIELARFTTGDARDPLTDPAAVLVDPWGQPYRYAYQSQVPWSNSSYVLWSVGTDGRDSGVLLTGGFADQGPAENADNIYANR